MHAFALILVCVVCAGHGHRMQTTSKRVQNRSSEEDHRRLLSPNHLKTLARLLLGTNNSTCGTFAKARPHLGSKNQERLPLSDWFLRTFDSPIGRLSNIPLDPGGGAQLSVWPLKAANAADDQERAPSASPLHEQLSDWSSNLARAFQRRKQELVERQKEFFSNSPFDQILKKIPRPFGTTDEDVESSGTPGTRQPVFAGNWRTARSVGLEDFLQHAMGVGKLKRSIAAKASQSQRVYQAGSVVHLEITDRRGTAHYELYPDGKEHASKGFMKLPIRQRCTWARDGSLVVEEKYFQHLGGELHGTKCSGKECPLIRSRRSVTKQGQMLVELERTLLSGTTVRTRTYYDPIKGPPVSSKD